MGCGATNSLENKKPVANQAGKSSTVFVVTKNDKFLNISNIRGDGQSIEQQTNSVMKKIMTELSKHGMKSNNIVKCECLLSDLENFAKFNECYGNGLGDWKPARLCVQDNLATGVLVQLNVIAAE